MPEEICDHSSKIDANNKRQAVFVSNEKIYMEFLSSFSKAEAHIKKAQVIDVRYENGLIIPSINELRYCSFHIVKALQASKAGDQKLELRKALAHCQRASYDALEIGVVTFLEIIQSFRDKNKFNLLVISEVIPNYTSMMKKATDAQDYISREHSNKGDHILGLEKNLDSLKDIASELNASIDELNAKKKNIKVKYLITIFTTMITTLALVVAAMTYYFP